MKSDASTLGAAMVAGAPDTAQGLLLDAGDTSGLTFNSVLADPRGTFTPVPAGAPAGTLVVNLALAGIAPTDIIGLSGFFEVFFDLPVDYVGASLEGAANADDIGRVFLNGHALTPSMFGGGSGIVTEYGGATFATSDPSYFLAGQNVLLVADDNSGSGPSGAAFYANISFRQQPSGVPEPGALSLLAAGVLGSGLAVIRRRR